MPAEKRKKERMNFWVTWVVRPLSVICTVPLIETRIKPSDITILSILFSIAGFFLVAYGIDDLYKVSGWLCFFAWAVLDGVDGNLARCTGATSAIGELWDAVGGYASMVLIYMSAGVGAFFEDSVASVGPNYSMIVLGGFCALASIFPRLIMHKKHNILPNSKADGVSDKTRFNLKQVVAMNLVSVSGFMQVIFLLCIITKTLNIFVIFYFILNMLIMLQSLRVLLHE